MSTHRLLYPLTLAAILATASSATAQPAAPPRAVAEIPPADKPLRVILDTDAACEVDDQHALALALLAPERFRIEGLIATHFGDAGGPQGIERSYQEILTVLEKAGMKGRYPVKRGSHPFRYSQAPEPSEGVDFLIERAMAPADEPLWIIALGAPTNVAAAYLKEPRIAERVVVFWHGRTQWPNKAWNFNAYNDLKAVRILFTSRLPLVLFDTGTHITLPMDESERRIRPHGPLGAYLHQIRFRSPAWQAPSKGLFDLGDIAALVDPSIIQWEEVDAPSVDWDMSYRHDRRHGRMLRIHDIDRDATIAMLEARLRAAADAPPAAEAAAAAAAEEEEAGRLWVYFGTYTRGESKGIYLAELDLASGRLSEPRLAGETENPSFLAVHPTRQWLYAVGEISEFEGQRTGAVSAFAIEPRTGRLTLLNRQSSGGGGPCHVTVDAAGRNLLVANYGGGSVAVLPIAADGRLLPAASVVQHEGSSVHPQRQQRPHAHSIYLDAAERFALACDLGIDRVLVYRFDAARGRLAAHDPPSTALPPGSGPRHLAFHPDGRFAYAINELTSTVAAMRYDGERGTLELIETAGTLPDDFDGPNTTAEVQVHPSGKFLYGSNRGHDSIAVFAIDPQSGRLRRLGIEPTRGPTPRNFGIDPTGRWLLAANQAGDSVTVFAIDAATGLLRFTGQALAVPAPVCVKFMRPRE